MPSLLTINGDRFQLDPNRCYVLGRGTGCDVVVDDVVCSRRHALLTVGKKGAQAFLEDLGSRNGTYVNELRISERVPLEHNSGIRIGATAFLVSLAEEPPGADGTLLDTATVAIEALSRGWDVGDEVVRVLSEGRTTTSFAGHLSSFGIIEVLQLLIQTSQSGTLHVALADGHARVELRRGEVLSASFRDLVGFPALLVLARQKQGMFWLVETTASCKKTITEPASRLLFELCHAIDEQDRA